MKFNEWIKEQGCEFNFIGPSMDAQTAVNFLREYLLVKDVHIPSQATIEQANTIIVVDILAKYSGRFRKELCEEEVKG